MRTLLPEGWPRPKGYSNGIEADGRIVFIAGQIGWTPEGMFEATTLAAQFAQTLDNTLAVLREANAGPEHVTRNDLVHHRQVRLSRRARRDRRDLGARRWGGPIRRWLWSRSRR